MGPRYRTRVLKLARQALYWLSHFTGPWQFAYIFVLVVSILPLEACYMRGEGSYDRVCVLVTLSPECHTQRLLSWPFRESLCCRFLVAEGPRPCAGRAAVSSSLWWSPHAPVAVPADWPLLLLRVARGPTLWKAVEQAESWSGTV